VQDEKTEFEPGDQVSLQVTVSRDDEDSDEEENALDIFNQPVSAQFYPGKKHEEWWVVIGHQASGKLLAIKKIANFRNTRSVTSVLSFAIGGGDFIKAGKSIADLKLYLMCDAYVGCDL
jgi:hypothetical protein